MILQYFIVIFILLIWITFNETDQRIRIHIEYSSCNRFALSEIFSQKFLRVFHFDDNDDEDEIHIDSKKRLVLIRKEDW
jgi:HSP20 family molecular chaperone IbpA